MDNILFVAASKSMVNITKEIMGKMGVSFPVVIGLVSDTQEIIDKNPSVEVFIARGRTAEYLQQLCNKPVIEITSSTKDILEPIQKLAANGVKRIAMVASPKLLGDSVYNYKIADVDVTICPCEVDKEEALMQQLQKQGVKGIICGGSTIKVAVKYGMEAAILETAEFSIKRAILEALKISKIQETERLLERERSAEIHQYYTKMYDAIEQASAAIEESVASSQELAATSQETSIIANKAHADAKSTSDIMEIIRHVAKETNLLGLNAAIEAARAGELGRGFSVVAAQVRKLSDDSNKSVQKVDSMLKNFINAMESVLKNVEQSNGIIQEQAKANQNIAEMIGELEVIGKNLMNMMERKS